jgi:hypothetical protein
MQKIKRVHNCMQTEDYTESISDRQTEVLLGAFQATVTMTQFETRACFLDLTGVNAT